MAHKILIRSDVFLSVNCPLEFFWQINPPRPPFQLAATQSFQGYTTTWHIEDRLLLLTKFSGKLMKMLPFEVYDAEFSAIFPGRTLPWFADWFTGKMDLVQSNPNRLSHDIPYMDIGHITISNGLMTDFQLSPATSINSFT